MPITLLCPNPACARTSVAPDGFTGRSVRCKACGHTFAVPLTVETPVVSRQPVGTSNEPFPALPALFGRYRVLRQLGRGGMGAVYLAEDTALQRHVALKIPTFATDESPERVERFLREARAAAGLAHPNVCTVFDVGRHDGRPFITMAYIDGKPLDAEIDPDRPMSQRRAAELARGIARALHAAHEKGIVHRDLKPANVMLTAAGEPVVMDFGLAKRVADADAEAREAKLTRDGAILGTPSYMAPEQVRGAAERIGPHTDVYALGVVLFQLLTGRVPYRGALGTVMGQILVAPVPPASEFRPDADPRLVAACARAMAKDPGDRFPTMAAFAEALDDYLREPVAGATVVLVPVAPNPFDGIDDHTAVEADAPAPLAPHGPRWLWPAVGLTACVSVGALVLVLVPASQKPPADGPEKPAPKPPAPVVRKDSKPAVPREVRQVVVSGPVRALAVDSKWKRIAAGTSAGTIHLIDAETGTVLDEFAEPRKGDIYALAFTPDAARLISSSIGVISWDLSGTRERTTLRAEPGGWWIASSPLDGTVAMDSGTVGLNPVDGTERVKFLDPAGMLAPTFLPRTGRLLAFQPAGTYRVYDGKTGTELARGTTLAASHPRRAAPAPDGHRVALAFGSGPKVDNPTGVGPNNAVWILDTESGKSKALPNVHAHTVWSVAWSSDGTRIASASWDKTVRIWDAATGDELHEVKHDHPLSDVALSPDGSKLVTACWTDNVVRIWELPPAKK